MPVAVVGCVPVPGVGDGPAAVAVAWQGQGPVLRPVKASGRRGPPRFQSGDDCASRCTSRGHREKGRSRFWKGWGVLLLLLEQLSRSSSESNHQKGVAVTGDLGCLVCPQFFLRPIGFIISSTNNHGKVRETHI